MDGRQGDDGDLTGRGSGDATASTATGSGLWKALCLVLALVVVGLGIATTRPDGGPRAVPQATVTVTVTAEPGTGTEPGADQAGATPQESAPVMTDEQAQWLLDLPRRDPADPRAKGDVDAPVVLTEWADHRCPFCAVWAEDTLPQLEPLVAQGLVRIEFRDLAIFGDDSVNAAAGARAAGEQGLFWEFQHALFLATPNQGHPDVGDDLVTRIAQEVGVADMDRFLVDYRSDAIRQAVLAESAEAQQMGISSTPTFLVGTEVVNGAQPISVFEAVVREQAALHG